ncbi:hypothetical protein ACFJIV_00480 [Mucilaginibacter sp. UC70_90]
MSTINSLLTSLIYPKKRISTDAILYKFINYNQIEEKTFKPQAGSFKDENLSCDWNKYSTPEKTRRLIGKQYKHGSKEFKNQKEFFICQLKVAGLLDLDPEQSFEHDPIFYFPKKKGVPNNRAHSLIIGKKTEKDQLKARAQLAMRAEWILFDEQEFKVLLEARNLTQKSKAPHTK